MLAHMSVHCATINRIVLMWLRTMWNQNIIQTHLHTTASYVTKSLAQIAHFKSTRIGVTNEKPEACVELTQ